MSVQPAPPVDATLSVTKAARLLSVHPNTVRAWSEQGRLRYYRINARGDRRYRVGDLRQFLAEAERGSFAPADAPGRRAASMPVPIRGRHGPAPMGGSSGRDRDDGSHRHPRHAAGESAILVDPRAREFRPSAARNAAVRPRPPVAHPAVETARSFRHLADLADVMATGRSLDTRLQNAARVIRQATSAGESAIWELRDDRSVRRARDSAAGTGPNAVLPPDAATRALSQRRPVIEPVRRGTGTTGVVGTATSGASGIATGTATSGTATSGTATHGTATSGRATATDIAIPIATDLPWGALAVRLEDVAPEDETVVWLEAAAGVIGAAIRSATLLEEAALEVHRGEALRRVAMDTNGSLDLDETLARVMDHAMVLFSADRGGVFVRRPDGEVEAAASRGLSAAYLAVVRRFPAPSLLADASAQRRPLFAVNYRDDGRASGFRAAVVQEGFDTICAAPLLDGEETIGLLNLYHDRPRRWSPAELETMAAFASQVTVAVRAAQQYTQLARWAAQLQSIQQLGARLNRLTTIPEIASAIATELGVLIQYDNIRVYRLDGDVLEAVALHATDAAYEAETPELVRTRVGEGITGWVAAHGLAQNLPDSSVDPRTEDIPGSDAFDESMLLAPLIFEDHVWGVIALASRGLARFSDDDLRLLEIYASIAAQAMANADATERLRAQSETLQRQIRSQRELLDITESILSTLDPGAVLGQIADRLGRLVRYDALAIDLTDRRTGTLVPLTVKGPDGEARRMPVSDDGLAGWVIRHNEARLVGGAAARPADSPAPSRIVLPLRGRDRVIGVLTLSRAADIEPFTGDDFELVQLFGAQVSIALHNAETHRAVEERARTDDLTGLLNHGSLREWLQRTAEDGRAFSLIMLDLDEFKAVNDAFGHQAGDRLLSSIGAAITAAGRETDLVFRYGGDEFAILLPGTDGPGAMQVAGRIAAAVRGVPRPRGRRDIHITASVGVATFPADGATGADMLLAADRACFVAKRAGAGKIADAAEGLALASEFSLQEPTPVDSSNPNWAADESLAPSEGAPSAA